MCPKVVLSPFPLRPLYPSLRLPAATPRLYKKYPHRPSRARACYPITDPTISQKREPHNPVLPKCLHFWLLPPPPPPSGSWTGRLLNLSIHLGSHDVAEQPLPSPKPRTLPNPPLRTDRQPPPCPRSDICIPIYRPRINTSDLLIPPLTRLLHSNTLRSRAPSDTNPSKPTRIPARNCRRSRNRTRTSTPLLRQRRGANGRHSVALVSKNFSDPTMKPAADCHQPRCLCYAFSLSVPIHLACHPSKFNIN